ncbi:MAG: nucleotidyltransferase domain-containing protein [Candidatus Woesearchaeota archaeon]
MDFSVERKEQTVRHTYGKEVLDVSFEFAKQVHKECGAFVKGIILFGSSVRKKEGRDIDILIVVDDLSVNMSKEFIQTYRIIVEKIISQVDKRLHVTTLKFTSFWEYARNGDPIVVNMLRDGVALIDTGFFDPLQALLYQGRIRPSAEAVTTYFSRAPMTISNSQWHILQACMDLYWAVIDAGHAALMRMGVVPPAPEHVADLLEEKLVKPGILKKEHAQTVRRFYHLSKLILNRDMTHMKGYQYDDYFKDAWEFVKAVGDFLGETPVTQKSKVSPEKK